MNHDNVTDERARMRIAAIKDRQTQLAAEVYRDADAWAHYGANLTLSLQQEERVALAEELARLEGTP